MKLILAVIFFGILTFAFAQYPDLKECESYNSMAGFQSSRFATGTWHVTNSKHGSTSTVCRQLTFKGNKITADGYYTFSGLTIYFEVSCDKQSETNGKMTYQCTQKGIIGGEQKSVPVRLELTVLSTDYNDYAVMYACGTTTIGRKDKIEGNILVLRRNANLKPNTAPKIGETLTSNRMSIGSFRSRPDTCPAPPQK